MQHRYTVGDVVYLASDLNRARPMTVVRRERERYAVVVWLDVFGAMNCKYLADAALVAASQAPLREMPPCIDDVKGGE